MAKSVSKKRTPPKVAPVVAAVGVAAARSAAGKAVQKLVAKHGAKIVQRALKAANTPAKGKTAGSARAKGAKYQEGVDSQLNFRNKNLVTRSRINIARMPRGYIGAPAPKSK